MDSPGCIFFDELSISEERLCYSPKGDAAKGRLALAEHWKELELRTIQDDDGKDGLDEVLAGWHGSMITSTVALIY